MQPRTLDAIISQLNTTFQPQVQNVQAQQALLPQQLADQEAGLGAKQSQAFDDILVGARRRGLGFSGIPLGEQAKYTATEYLPALANLRYQGNQNYNSLQNAILGINERRDTLGQQIYGQEQSLYQQQLAREQEQRQFEANLAFQREQLAQQAAQARAAAASSAFNLRNVAPTTNGSDGGTGLKDVTRKPDGGYAFTNQYGNPISAAAYSAMYKVPFIDLLQILARGGDTGAKTALGFVGNDYGYDPGKVNTPELASIYNNLVWGTPANQASVQAQGPAPNIPDPNQLRAINNTIAGNAFSLYKR